MAKKPSLLSTAEAAFTNSKIVEASRILAEWLCESRGERCPQTRIRAHLLATNLALLAGRRLKARRHLQALETRIPAAVLLPLKARLLLLNGKAGEATELCDSALESLDHDGIIAIRASLLRQRGLIRLEAAEIAQALADLYESLRLSRIAGDDKSAVETSLDIAEAALALGDTTTAAKIIPAKTELLGRCLSRAEKLEWSLAETQDPGTAPERGGKPITLTEAELLLENARISAHKNDISAARNALVLLEEEGWLDAVEQFRGEALLLRAYIALEASEAEKATTLVVESSATFSPGLAIRLGPTLKWLEMKAFLQQGNRAAALRSGRKLIKDLEHLRSGLFALDHLRRFSNDYADLFRTIIVLELRYGQPKKAFEALQHFSARALLRKAGAAPIGKISKTLTAPNLALPDRDPGGWVLREIFQRGAKTPDWRSTIKTLKNLGLEEDDQPPRDKH